MARNSSTNGLRCSFCGRPTEQVPQLITGPGVQICSDCVGRCTQVLNSGSDDIDNKPAPEESNLPSPRELRDHLDKYVIGQDMAKKALCVAVYNHYKRVRSTAADDGDLDKSNILFLGPTGSGKTLLAQTLAKFLNVPFTIADATVLTEAGYVGEDVDSIIVRLLQAADYDAKRAERGIIFIDEVDKIARKSANASITRDVSGEGVQQGLLKLLEGSVSRVPPKGGRKHPEQPLVEVNTRNILFVCGGAFEGLDKIIARRVNKSGMGFGAEVRSKSQDTVGELFRLAEPDDLVQFGLIPELIGRLPLIVGLDELDRDALMQILTVPKNCLVRQYEKLFALDGMVLRFEDDALNAIVDLAVARKTGARGLRSIMENTLLDVMYNAPSRRGEIREVVVTADVVLNKAQPQLVLL